MIPLRPLVLGALLLAAAGCSSPASRIKKNPEKFAALPAATQERVKQGVVAPGDTADAAFLAMGEPNRKYTRRTAQGETEVWSYTGVNIRTENRQMRVPVQYRDRDGRSRTSYETVWIDVQHEEEYERTRLEVVDGKVTAVESTRR